MPRKYGTKATQNVRRAMRKMKRGKLESGKSHRKVKNQKQAIAIGLSEARRKGAKVPPKKTSGSASKKSTRGSHQGSSSAKSSQSRSRPRTASRRSSGSKSRQRSRQGS